MNLQPIVYKTIAPTNCASPPLRSPNFTIKRASITAIKYEKYFVPTKVPMWLYTAEAAVGYIVLEYQRCAALFHRLLWLVTGHHCTREGPFSRSFSRLAAHLLNTTHIVPLCFHVRSTMSMYASVNYPHQYRRISSAVMYLRPLSRRTLVSMPPHCAPMFIAL